MRLKVVIAGLDPAIHPLRMMDTRVKPAYDAVHKESFAEISSANRRTAVDHNRLPGHEQTSAKVGGKGQVSIRIELHGDA